MAVKRGRKAWSEGVAERRGPKTCLPESRTWNLLAPFGLQPGPLAFICLAITLKTGKALALIHSRAYFFVITGDFWYVSVLVGNETRFSQNHANFLGGPVR